MNADILFFICDHMAALPMYETLETLIAEKIPDIKINVSKTQISFSNKRGFAFVSFTPCRRVKDGQNVWMTITFGLGDQKISPRIDGATELYPNRWTHHVMVGDSRENDVELIEWMMEAAAFSAAKR